MIKQKYEYISGILDRRDDWLWQGHVVAHNSIQARKLLRSYQKKNLRNLGKIEIDAGFKFKTNKKIGVYSA